MKYYEDEDGNLFAFESDGSQDHLIPGGLTLLTTEQADTALTPGAETMITMAKARIHAAFEMTYRTLIETYTGQPYSQADITSWPMQEAEAWDYMVNGDAAITQWMDAYAIVSGTTKALLALATTQRQVWYKANYIALTAIRFNALAEIDALGAEPTQEQLDTIVDAIVWPS